MEHEGSLPCSQELGLSLQHGTSLGCRWRIWPTVLEGSFEYIE